MIITARAGNEKNGERNSFFKATSLGKRRVPVAQFILICLAGYGDLNGFSVLLSVNELLFQRQRGARKSIVIIFILNRLFKVLKASEHVH